MYGDGGGATKSTILGDHFDCSRQIQNHVRWEARELTELGEQ